MGLVGAGYIADFHALALSGMKGVDLVGVCDPDIRSARSCAERWGVQEAFPSLEVMLKAGSIDCVHILAPPDLHHSLAREALDAGVKVFLEKPMCTSVADAEDLCAVASVKNLQSGR